MITCRNMGNFKIACIFNTTCFLGPRKYANRVSQSHPAITKAQNIQEMVHEGRVVSHQIHRYQGDVEFIDLSGSVLSWTRRKMIVADEIS